MESKQRYHNFLLSVKTDNVGDVAKERHGYIQTQVPNSIRYATGNIAGSGHEAVLYIAISFVHGRHPGGLKSEFLGWKASGFSTIKAACEHTPNDAEQVFVVGDVPHPGKCKLSRGAKKRTWDELESDNQMLREQNNNLIDQLKQASEASKAREYNLTKQLKQAGETIKARETAGMQFLDGYLRGVNQPDLLGVLNTIETIVNPSSSRPILTTKREAYFRYHPDKQNSRHGADKDREWNTQIANVVCRHIHE